MKKIMVAMDLNEEKRGFLTEAAKGCKEEAELLFRNGAKWTEEDVKDADAVIGTMPVALMKSIEKLEWQQLSSAGADAVIKAGYLPEYTTLTNASGAYDLSVSEHMIAQTFAMIRNMGRYMIDQTKAEWKNEGPALSIEESAVLVLGAGHIGNAYAKKMKALGAYTIGVKRTPAEKPEYYDELHTIDELDALLPRAEIVAMVLPGGDATVKIMDERRLRLMKKGSCILNVGRGNAIDPEGLYKVLAEGHLKAAALDVTDPEPLPADDRLWGLDNIIITPHVAGGSSLATTSYRFLAIAAENIKHYLNGEALINIVDKKLGY
jgi:phosphoglycerate dehydrogenase-like enzyme